MLTTSGGTAPSISWDRVQQIEMTLRFYRQPAANASGSVRNLAFSAVMSATHRLLNADVPRDAEILANIIAPEVLKSAISSYDLGTGPVPKGLLPAEDVAELVAVAVERALESHDERWFSLKQAAAASKHSPLVLEDPALAGMSATQIAEAKKVTRRTVFRWRTALKQATPQDRKRWAAVSTIRQHMTSTIRRYKRLRDAWAKPRPERKIRTVPPVSQVRTLPAEIMNLLDSPPTPSYPKMTYAGMLASLGASAAKAYQET